MSETVAELRAILGRESEADDALRATVSVLAAAPGAVWAGIAFVEEGEFVLGPSAGEPDEERRAQVPISYSGDVVGELRVDGNVSPSLLAEVAELVSSLVLIGWDTRGEAWEP